MAQRPTAPPLVTALAGLAIASMISVPTAYAGEPSLPSPGGGIESLGLLMFGCALWGLSLGLRRQEAPIDTLDDSVLHHRSTDVMPAPAESSSREDRRRSAR